MRCGGPLPRPRRLGTLNKEGAGVLSVSCSPVGNCAAGGEYAGRSLRSQGFVTQ